MRILLRRIVPILLVFALLASCVTPIVVVAPKKIPPGHAKKMTGSKSAKPYAPGQQKKKKY